MKKIIALFGIFAVVQCCVGQGTVSMANNGSTLVRRWTSGSDPTPINVAANNGKVEFLWAPLGTTDINLFQTVAGASPVNIAPTPGRFASATAITVPGIAPGGIIAAVLRAWVGPYLTYAEAVVSTPFVDYSSIFSVDTGDPTAIPAGTPGNIVTSIPGQGFPGMTIVVTPEPSSLAVLGLGSVAMIFLRRRR